MNADFYYIIPEFSLGDNTAIAFTDEDLISAIKRALDKSPTRTVVVSLQQQRQEEVKNDPGDWTK